MTEHTKDRSKRFGTFEVRPDLGKVGRLIAAVVRTGVEGRKRDVREDRRRRSSEFLDILSFMIIIILIEFRINKKCWKRLPSVFFCHV